MKKRTPKKNESSNPVAFLEDLKRQWIATIDAVQEPLLQVDDTFKILKSNRAMAEWSGIDVKKLQGEICYKVFAGRTKPCEGCPILSQKNSKKLKSSQTFVLDRIKGGHFFEVSSSLLDLTDNKQRSYE